MNNYISLFVVVIAIAFIGGYFYEIPEPEINYTPINQLIISSTDTNPCGVKLKIC